MSFALYILGFLILISGVAWALGTAGVSTVYVMITCVILLGIGIVSAVTHTRSKDRPKDPSA
jgi:amino acid transporter